MNPSYLGQSDGSMTVILVICLFLLFISFFLISVGFPGRRINHLCVFTLRVLPSLALSPCFRAPFLSFSFYFSSVVVRSMAIICFDRKQFERKEFTGRSVDYLGSLEHFFWKHLPLLSFFSALNITKGNLI